MREVELGLDIVELFAAVEERFGIRIPDKEAQEATTPGELADLVFSKLAERETPNQWTKDAVWLAVREVIVKETGAKDFTRDSNFVDDIGLD